VRDDDLHLARRGNISRRGGTIIPPPRRRRRRRRRCHPRVSCACFFQQAASNARDAFLPAPYTLQSCPTASRRHNGY